MTEKYHVTVSNPAAAPFLTFELEVEDHAGAVFVTLAVLEHVRTVINRRGEISDGEAIMKRQDGRSFHLREKKHDKN